MSKNDGTIFLLLLILLLCLLIGYICGREKDREVMSRKTPDIKIIYNEGKSDTVYIYKFEWHE